ncbi:hypothetical protein [Metaclostridioides mangenotii]|uniref:Uncharacterized protein n=1 Tax=Metaclostridioides mangenotii TaxID=1540 RepID=A0ABS4EB27_9FIRM|nr:hypothetical protein [Clostridioides mangenotii]MBP1855111.1 hypothetical protein [Clostridioides mangenotii]
MFYKLTESVTERLRIHGFVEVQNKLLYGMKLLHLMNDINFYSKQI